MADDFLYGMARQGLADTQRDLKICWKALQDERRLVAGLKKQLAEAQDKILDYKFSTDKRDTHLAAERAQSRYLMGELDRISGGRENNPARQDGCDPDKARIPSGARKGEVVTVADKVYLEEFRDQFAKRSFASKWGEDAKTWIQFLHSRISY